MVDEPQAVPQAGGGQAKSPEFAALETIYSALQPLDPQARQRVLASLYALLDIRERSPAEPAMRGADSSARSARPVSIIELMKEKKPDTHPEHIALFAYYRDKYEGKTRFARGDLLPYYGLAKVAPPGNYDRDFIGAVKNAWIHEDGADSYITSKGIEAVEEGFSPSEVGAKPAKKKKKAR